MPSFSVECSSMKLKSLVEPYKWTNAGPKVGR